MFSLKGDEEAPGKKLHLRVSTTWPELVKKLKTQFPALNAVEKVCLRYTDPEDGKSPLVCDGEAPWFSALRDYAGKSLRFVVEPVVGPLLPDKLRQSSIGQFLEKHGEASSSEAEDGPSSSAVPRAAKRKKGSEKKSKTSSDKGSKKGSKKAKVCLLFSFFVVAQFLGCLCV